MRSFRHLPASARPARSVFADKSRLALMAIIFCMLGLVGFSTGLMITASMDAQTIDSHEVILSDFDLAGLSR